MYLSNNKFAKNSQGFNLIEMLIALSLAMVLPFGIYKIYIDTWHFFKVQAGIVKLNHAIFKVTAVLSNETAKAGNIGCALLQRGFPVFSENKDDLTAYNKIMGQAHAFTVRYAEFPSSVLLNEIKKNDQQLLISKNIHYFGNEKLIVSDCEHAEIIQLTKAHYRNNNVCLHIASPLQQAFKRNAEVARMVINRFYVDKIRKKSDTEFGIFYEDIKRKKHLLIENVVDMTLHYYIIYNGKVQQVTSEKVIDWSSVIALNIQLNIKAAQFLQRIIIVAPVRHFYG